MHWYFKVLKKYAVFSGRARRSEYWYFYFCHLIIVFALIYFESHSEIETGSAEPVLSTIYALAVAIPCLAVINRRLHDSNRSGWASLVGLIPLIGGLIFIAFMLQDSQPGENQYGPNPKGIPAKDPKEDTPKTKIWHDYSDLND